MFPAIAAAFASSAASAVGSKLFGGGGSSAPQDDGIKSMMQGSTVPSNEPVEPQKITGTQAFDWAKDKAAQAFEQIGDKGIAAGIDSVFSKGIAKNNGKANRAYLDAAFPELNPWEKAGAGATDMGTAQSEQNNQKEMLKMQLDNQKDIAKMQNQTQLDIAGLQSRTSIQNTKDQVFAQNEKLNLEKQKMATEIGNLIANRSLTNAQVKIALQRIIESQARVYGINATTGQTYQQTEKILEEILNIRQDTQNKKYGNGHISREALSLSNAISDGLSDLGSRAFEAIGGIGSAIGGRFQQMKDLKTNYNKYDNRNSGQVWDVSSQKWFDSKTSGRNIKH